MISWNASQGLVAWVDRVASHTAAEPTQIRTSPKDRFTAYSCGSSGGGVFAALACATDA